MRFLRSLLATVAFVATAAGAHAADIKNGIDYQTLDTPVRADTGITGTCSRNEPLTRSRASRRASSSIPGSAMSVLVSRMRSATAACLIASS